MDLNEQLARETVADRDYLVSAPIINAPIHEGRAVIHGEFTQAEAERIATGIFIE